VSAPMPEVQPTALPPETAARLTAFARACRGAARTVSLYPPEHRAIGDAMERLALAAASATESGPLSILVLPNNLLVGGQTTPRPDTAIVELAALLHAHMVGEITIRGQVEMPAWRTLLDLLGSNPEDLRARGGLARALTTAGGVGIEIAEIDYSGLINDEASGAEASWEFVISACMRKDGIDLDEKTLRILEEIACDPARLAEFYERTERQPGASSTRDRAIGLLRALEGVAGLVERQDPARLDGLYDNMADAVSCLSPEFVGELLEIGRDPASPHAGIVDEMTRRVTDQAVARFVARAVAVDRGCTARLADAFRTLAPDPNRRESIARLTREELEQTPLVGESDFADVWSDVEGLLLSYSDARYISKDYDREMALARSRADDSDQITDDPPERIARWLTTVSDQSIRALDLQLLADLLLVVADSEKREELLQLVVSQVDELVALGDFDAAHRLAESMAALATKPEAPDAAALVARAIQGLVGGPFMSQAAVHLNSVRDEEFEHVKKLCAAIGPALVPRLADTLSAETRNRARQRLTDLLIAFGAHGRDSADKLKVSPNPSVRRTAVQLLRAFGGPEALADLEQLVNDTEPAVQRDAARAIIGFGIDESFLMLQRILESAKHRGHATVVEELGSTRDQKAAPLFCYLVRHIEPRGALRGTYMDAIGRLGVLGGSEAVAALVEVLEQGSWWAPFRTREIRTEAAGALAQMRFPAAQEALANAAANGSLGVRAVARKFVRTA
jgi:hypothetical protein